MKTKENTSKQKIKDLFTDLHYQDFSNDSLQSLLQTHPLKHPSYHSEVLNLCNLVKIEIPMFLSRYFDQYLMMIDTCAEHIRSISFYQNSKMIV